MSNTPLLQIHNLCKDYPNKQKGLFGQRGHLRVLDNVTLSVRRGESFGLVGESGSGKTTLTRCILGLEPMTAGSIEFDGQNLSDLSQAEIRRLRASIQIVFQDPYASLNPRMTVHDIISEPMIIHRKTFPLSTRQRNDRVIELLAMVGLNQQHLFRFPNELSGGQRQRIAIARALALKPKFLILDEATSALDISVQAQVLNLLHGLQNDLGLTYFFITHDLGVVRHFCDRVALIYRGKVVDDGDASAVFDSPRSDYARLLRDSIPLPDPALSPFRNL